MKKVNLNLNQKEILEEISGSKIFLRNSFEKNQNEISELLEQGKKNAAIYLDRNRLGQKLNLFEENNLFLAVDDLRKKLGLSKIPRRIECYDISHLSGTDVYGSMVVFIDGRANKKLYKLFRTKQQNNDFANHKEVLLRRFRRYFKWLEENNLDFSAQVLNTDTQEDVSKRDFIQDSNKENPWEIPDLIVVDGGKGQLSYDIEVMQQIENIFRENNLDFKTEICALAKREEEVFTPDILFNKTNLEGLDYGKEGGILLSGESKFLMQRVRDEAHRFAITNNRKARLKKAHKSKLDEVPGIGPKTKIKLLKIFESVEGIVQNLSTNYELVVESVGEKNAQSLKNFFKI